MEPDLIVSAKSIAAGLPLGAVTAARKLWMPPPPAAWRDLRRQSGGLRGGAGGAEDVRRRATCCPRGPDWRVDRSPHPRVGGAIPLIGDIRGMGAMRAFELVRDRGTRKPAKEETENIIKYCWQHGLIILSAGTYGNVIRLLLPLVVTDDQLEEGFSVLEAGLASVSAPAAVAIRN